MLNTVKQRFPYNTLPHLTPPTLRCLFLHLEEPFHLLATPTLAMDELSWGKLTSSKKKKKKDQKYQHRPPTPSPPAPKVR